MRLTKCNWRIIAWMDILIIIIIFSDKHIDDQNSIFSLRFSLFSCEVCKKQFVTKKQLRTHIHTHLGRPRIVLKRVTNLKGIKKKHSNRYWLDPEKKGSLKLTLKKQSFTDSLKLKLKKSSESEDFTVVKSNINLGTENHGQRDVAGAKENDQRHEKDTESSINQSFENVMVEQQVCHSNEHKKMLIIIIL